MGVPGTVVTGGFVQENERNPNVAGVRKYRTYSEILANTTIVAAGVRLFLNLAAKAQWTVEPAKDERNVAPPSLDDDGTFIPAARSSSASALEVADFVYECMGDMETSWSRMIRRSAMFRLYGFSVQEWTAKRRDDGRIAYEDVAPRPQKTIEQWDQDTTGRVLNIGQRAPQTGELLWIPRTKCVYVTDDSLNDSPEGLGLFRHLVESNQRLKRYMELEGFGFETDLRGIPIGRAPIQALDEMVAQGTISEEQKALYLDTIKQFIGGHIKNPNLGLLLDSVTYQTQDEKGAPSNVPKWDMELLSGDSTSSGQIEVGKSIERVTREMARVLGVEHLLLGEGTSGSHALSKDKSHQFALIVDSTITELRETYERDWLRPLMTMNGIEKDLWPTFKVEPIQFRDIEQITNAIKDLAQAGVMLDPQDDAVPAIFHLMGLPAPDPNLAEARMQQERRDRENELNAKLDVSARAAAASVAGEEGGEN